MALATLFEGPYGFSLLFKRTRASSCADGTGSNMADLERLINGERAATPKVAPAPRERRNPLRDAIIVVLQGSGLPERTNFHNRCERRESKSVAIPPIAWSESRFRRRSHIRLQGCR